MSKETADNTVNVTDTCKTKLELAWPKKYSYSEFIEKMTDTIVKRKIVI